MPVQLDLVNALIRELEIIASIAYPVEFPQVIEMLESGKVDVNALISHRFSLSDFQQALSTAQKANQAIKVLVNCQQ